MPTVNELLDKAKAELSIYYPGKYSFYEICLSDMSGTEFRAVIDCSLAPYFSI